MGHYQFLLLRKTGAGTTYQADGADRGLEMFDNKTRGKRWKAIQGAKS
jgi:hypothetical protein